MGPLHATAGLNTWQPAVLRWHDYADYYPGVKAFVHEMLRTGTYTQVRCVRSMMVVQKQLVAALVANEGPTRSRDGQRSRRDA